MTEPARQIDEGARMSVELTNICNLRCGYCFRDEDVLYHTPAKFFPVELLRGILRDARETCGIESASFTGGEVTIHPNFAEIVEMIAAEGMRFGFVTNGWHFDRVHPVLMRHRESVSVVGFSLDGATREAHDRWRGEGSFVRLMRGVARCYMSGIPFLFKVGIRQDTVPQLQEIALLAARLGARAVHFAHLLPTSSGAEAELSLSHAERTAAEQEVAILSKIFKMEVGVVTGYYNVDAAPPCTALRGTSCNVDYRGRLSLCCNLSGYRGASGETDVVADLNLEPFSSAYPRLRQLAHEQLERRRVAIEQRRASGAEIDLYTGSPCLFCLQSFGKIPWRDAAGGSRSLPVLPTARPESRVVPA
ncbi:MAG TPA: radical SAM protein [Pyrinomonadaceae bacterium]|nr:radical SAM protein [Pyrinomonadaceae bacterium]